MSHKKLTTQEIVSDGSKNSLFGKTVKDTNAYWGSKDHGNRKKLVQKMNGIYFNVSTL